MKSTRTELSLPAPKTSSSFSLEKVLAVRRSVRDFKKHELAKEMISQLLWSMQGVTDAGGYRTAPSAGALYPLETYVATHEGLFHYEPDKHEICQLTKTDLRKMLCSAALGQQEIEQAPAVFIITAVMERTAAKYGSRRAERYVFMECGHAAENLLLQAVALGLGAVPLGAFNDQHISETLGLPAKESPLYLIPVGYAR